MGYENKWALVTGAGRKGRIGATIAKRLASEGANIYLNHRKGGQAEAEEVKHDVESAGAAFKVQVVLVEADLSQKDDVSKIFTDITPDIIIHNAAVFEPARVKPGATVKETVDEHTRAFDLNIDVNLRPLIVATEAAIASLKNAGKTGTFVFIGDAFIDQGGIYDPSLGSYTVSKVAARFLARHFANAYGAQGFKFFAVLNGPIEPPPSAPAETVKDIADEIPLPQDEKNPWIGGDAVAAGIVHGIAMTEEAGFNGGAILVDGGRAWTTAKEHKD